MDIDNDFSYLLDDLNMDYNVNSQELMDDEMRVFQNANNVEDKLESANKLVLNVMPTTSIFSLENKIFKDLVPALKTIYLNIFKDLEIIVSSEKDLDEKSQILQKHLLMCISVLEILDTILKCLSKNEEFGLSHIPSIPLNVLEMLLITFEHCKNSNVFYKEFSNVKDIIKIFKLGCDVHCKLLTLIEHHVNITVEAEDDLSTLKTFLQFLVKIGKILRSMSVKAMVDNWRGYINISEKFSHFLNGRCSIKDPVNSLGLEIEMNLKRLLEDTKNTQNINSIVKHCDFCMKIIVKLSDIFLGNDQEDWDAVFMLLLNIYSYHPVLLRHKGCTENVVNKVEATVFFAENNFLQRLCGKIEFYKMFTVSNCMHASSENCLLLIIQVFKNSLLTSEESISYIPQIIEIFFNALSKGYFEFWKIILTSNNQTLYEDNINNMVHIIRVLPTKEYNQTECILFRNIFSTCVWNSLTANDIWCTTLRNDTQLSYETVCNIIKLSESLLTENLANRPQLSFLKNLLTRLGGNLSENHKQLLVDQYPLHTYLHVWKILGFEHFHKQRIAFVINTVVDKSNLLINKKSSLEDFKALCASLEMLSVIPKNRDFSHLLTVLWNLWNFIFSSNWRDSFYSRYLIRKLLSATNAFLLEFSNTQLSLILSKMRELLDADVSLKILISSSLTVLSKKIIKNSPEQNQIFTNISGIFFKLLTDKNQIIQQNSLEVFFQFGEFSQYDVIVQNAIKNDYELERRISNFVQNNIVDNRALNWEEYFQLQSSYKFCHRCPCFKDLKRLRNTETLSTVTESNTKDEIIKVVENIKSSVELFYRLSGKHYMIHAGTTEIMKILNK